MCRAIDPTDASKKATHLTAQLLESAPYLAEAGWHQTAQLLTAAATEIERLGQGERGACPLRLLAKLVFNPIRALILGRSYCSAGDRRMTKQATTLKSYRKLLVVALAALGQVAAVDATAQVYPTRPIRLIAPFGAGSAPDGTARLLAQHLSDRLGQRVLVDNRPGAGTTIGTKAAANADPDGYTLLLANSTLSYTTVLYPNPGYDPLKSFAPVAGVAEWSHVLAVHTNIPVNTVQELIAYAKTHPGQLNFGFPLLNPPQILSETFKIVTATDINSIPYRGIAQLIPDSLSGRVQLNFLAYSTLLPLIQDGRVRPLAYAGATRSPYLPDVPTMIESGLPQMTFSPGDWTGILAPAGTPIEVISTLNAAINECLGLPDVQAGLTRLGWDAKIVSPSEFAAFLSAEAEKWPPLAKAAGLKAE